MKKNSSKKRLNGCSLFSSAGIAEEYFSDAGIDIVAANELLKDRADLYRHLHQKTNMIQGDILDKTIFNKIIEATPKKLDFLIASPPCQGMSVAGSNRSLSEMLKDERNFLVKKIVEFIEIKKPDYILIENVPTFLKLKLPHNGKLLSVEELLTVNFGKEYTIEAKVLNAADFGVPQQRKRAIIKLFKKGLSWNWPKEEKNVKTVKAAISHLPSLEAGEKSNIPWHFARKHSKEHVLWMQNTPTGKSAFENKKYFPKKKDGSMIKGYLSSYRRINWDQPAPTITMRNDAISSQRNVHPGKLRSDGTYSDARVLTPLELILLTSLPEDWDIPKETSEILIRKCIGESIPPLMVKKIVELVGK